MTTFIASGTSATISASGSLASAGQEPFLALAAAVSAALAVGTLALYLHDRKAARRK